MDSQPTHPYYIVESDKPFAAVVADLDAAVKRNQFGVLHVHDLGATLRSKGQPFDEECKVFEVCNPRHAADVLKADPRVNAALPCRMVEPEPMLEMLSGDPTLRRVAREVGEATRRMIDEAR